jgi:hypothetical protein
LDLRWALGRAKRKWRARRRGSVIGEGPTKEAAVFLTAAFQSSAVFGV